MSNSADPTARYYIKPKTGAAFAVQKDDIIRVIDVAGEQVADLVCFARHDIEEYLSSGRTIDYNEKLFLSTGDILYSNRSNPMLCIIEDPVGKHDFLFAPCSREMFKLKFTRGFNKHDRCHEFVFAIYDKKIVWGYFLSLPMIDYGWGVMTIEH